MTRPLVVVGEPVLAGAEGDRPARVRGERQLVARADGPRAAPARVEQPAEDHRLQHRLGVLELVAQDHLVQVRVRAPLVQDLERPCAHRGEMVERLVEAEQSAPGADGARGVGGVVQRGEVGPQQGTTAVAVHEPQVLVRREVAEVPDQRAPERVDLAFERLAGQWGDELEGPPAHGGQVGGDVGGGDERDGGHGSRHPVRSAGRPRRYIAPG
jgi:hypothetical protein